MANPDINDIIATTLRSRTGMLADNVSHNVALLRYLKKRGNYKIFTGGSEIDHEISYDSGDNEAGWYVGSETLNIAETPRFTAAKYGIRQAYAPVTMVGNERFMNMGKEKVIDLARSKLMNAEKKLMNLVSTGLYSDGTGDGGRQLDGLQHQVSSAPSSGTVGGINRATYAWWRNRATSVDITKANIKAQMQTMYINLCRNADKPDLIPAGNHMYGLYWDSLTDLQRFSNKMDPLGFGGGELKFHTANVVLDGGVDGDAPNANMYFLNTDFIHFRPVKGRNFEPSQRRLSTNQDADVMFVWFAGNLTMGNARLQGVLIDSSV